MLSWLDSHAAAVQAIATMVLVGITAWYAYLTHKIAGAAAAGTEIQRQAAVAQRLRFVGIAARLGLAVRSLPDDRNDSKIREAVLWGDDEVAQLTTLAATLGVSTAVDAETAAISLRWLADRVRYVKAAPLSVDRGPRIPADEWIGHLRIARTALLNIEQREATPLALQDSLAS